MHFLHTLNLLCSIVMILHQMVLLGFKMNI